MNEISYPFEQPRIEYRYEFLSVSSSKQVRKLVLLTLTEFEDIYNLALLDLLPNGETSDISEYKNNDLKIILTTVINVVIDFLDKKPSTIILFQGRDEKRQRLYRIAINQELEVLQKVFNIFGSISDEISLFKPNKPYDFFLISKK